VSGTVIEQLTTKLGLDVSDFKKGIGEAKKSMDDLKGGAEESGNAIGGMIGGVAKKATGSLGMLGSVLGKSGMVGLGIGAAIYMGKKLDDALFKVAVSLRQVSIESKNVGQSAAGLRNLQNASVLAGGSIEDAAQTVGDLQKSLFNLRFNGQVSDQIVMLSRLGVQFQDSYGRAREFNDVMLDTAAALEKAQKNGEMTRPEAAIFAQQAGFTGGMQQLVLSGPAGVQAELAKQRARTQINDKMIGAGTAWVRDSASMGQAGEAELGNKSVGAFGYGRAAADRGLEAAGKYTMDFLTAAGDKLSAAVDRLTNFLSGLFGGAKPPAEPVSQLSGVTGRGGSRMVGANAWHSTIAAAAKRNGVPEEILTGLIRKESSFDPSAVGKPTPSGTARGIAQILPGTGKELGVTPGQNAAADIDAAARYLKQLHDQAATSGMASGNVMPWVVATSAYHAGMGNVRSGKNIGPESLAYSGQVMQGLPGFEEAARGFRPGSDGATITNEIQIDQITVQTQATDADGIAGSIGDAARRKLLTAQAETGIQ